MDADKIVMQQIQQVNLDRAETMGKCSVLYQHCISQGILNKYIVCYVSKNIISSCCVVLLLCLLCVVVCLSTYHADITPAQLRLNLMKKISGYVGAPVINQGNVQ